MARQAAFLCMRCISGQSQADLTAGSICLLYLALLLGWRLSEGITGPFPHAWGELTGNLKAGQASGHPSLLLLIC